MKELSIEEKAKAYDEALERCRKLYNEAKANEYNQDLEDYETIFPELRESEDERIRKEIISVFTGESSFTPKEEAQKYVAWLEKQGKQKPVISDDALREGIAHFGITQYQIDNWLKKYIGVEKQGEQKQFYIRFGGIPEGEKSSVWRGDEFLGKENGVSVYPAFKHNGNIVLGLSLPITKTTLYTLQHLLEYDNRPCYLVIGDYIGNGADGEPLIRNVEIVEEIKDFRVKEGEARYKIKDSDNLSFNGQPFDYEKATITQKDFEEIVNAVKDTSILDMVGPKFKVGDIISNGKVVYRVDNIVKNCVGKDCYFLVNIKKEKDGMRYAILSDSQGNPHNSGEITWLCEQVDVSFNKQLSQSATKVSDKVWSDEDEEILKNLIDYFSLDDGLRLPTEETID